MVVERVFPTMIEDCPFPRDKSKVDILPSEGAGNLPEIIERVYEGQVQDKDEYGDIIEPSEVEIDRFFGTAAEDGTECAMEGLL